MNIDETLKERGTVHGDFRDNAALAQRLKRIMHNSKNWEALPDVHREALHMVQHKIARLLSGDWQHPDHVHDMIGYLTLIENEDDE